MHETSWRQVESWWAEVLAVEAGELWAPGVRVTRQPDGEHDLLVAWRGEAVHVALPAWVGNKVVKDLRRREAAELTERSFWKSVAKPLDRTADHPTVHAYTDAPVAPARGVETVDPAEVAPWRDDVKPEKWSLSGFGSEVLLAYGVRDGKGRLAAAASVSRARHSPPTVGVLTHPSQRGRGFGSRVVRGATAGAVEKHGLGAYKVRCDDERGRSIGAGLGYEEYCEQLLVH